MTIDFRSARRLLILVGVLAVAALGFAVLTLERATSSSTSATPLPVHHVAKKVQASHPAKHRAAPLVKLNPGLPGPIRYALQRHRSVVVALHGGNSVDKSFAKEARAGAALAHASFLSIDVRKQKWATTMAGFDNSVANPALLVVRRPGVVVTQFEGVQDRQVVAQAAHDAR